jgi:hypothetical protein
MVIFQSVFAAVAGVAVLLCAVQMIMRSRLAKIKGPNAVIVYPPREVSLESLDRTMWPLHFLPLE